MLIFRIDTWQKREWDNSKSPIESNFPAIFAKLGKDAAERNQMKIDSEKWEIQQEKEKKSGLNITAISQLNSKIRKSIRRHQSQGKSRSAP